MRLFLDANILFTAAYSPEGVSRSLFALAAAGSCFLWSSRFACEEARRNIELKAADRLSDLEELITRVSVTPEPSPDAIIAAGPHGLPGKDVPILAAAITCAADILITGDRRDFGPLMGKTVAGITVLAPREALARLLDRIEGS